jgi:acetate---CoA ligase (ADP-forming)
VVEAAPGSIQTSARSSRSGRRVLDGWRGGAPGDRKAAARGMAALSRFMADFAGEIEQAEINPFAVLEEGRACLALDCVIVPRGKDRS